MQLDSVDHAGGCLVVMAGDPLYKSLEKGEVKLRYWNPCNIFDDVHVISLCERDVDPSEVQDIAGDACLTIHPVGRPTPLTLMAYFRRVAALARTLKPDIVRVHGPFAGGALGVYAAKCLDVPSLVSVHNEIDVMRRHERRVMLNLIRPLECYSLGRASAVLCVSEYVRKYALRHGARRSFLWYNRVYSEQFAHTRKYDVPAVPTLLSVMRMDPIKDPFTLVRSIARLKVRVRLVLIGQGALEAEVRDLVRNLGLEDRVQFIPMVPNRLIHEQYAAADIFVMSTHYEGFCIPVLEAMASGLPIVASNTEPIPEILGDTGLLVERRPEAFAAALEKLLGDRELRRRLGQAARARAVALDGARMERREAEIYRAFMEGDQREIERLEREGPEQMCRVWGEGKGVVRSDPGRC